MRSIRCEWCGNIYSDEREWCPRFLAPRSKAIYADNVAYWER